jgi:radical SAM protein with 4Fe4S-binding SPASM domain
MINHLPEEFGMKHGAEKFPLMVVLSFSYVCNARCPNCPYNNSDIRSMYKDFMFIPDDLFKKICDECGKYGAFVRLSGGGEPMLHPHALELVSYAKQVGAKVGIITNGSKFTHVNLARLLSINTDVIEFSADAGNSDTYAKVRPGLSWEKLVANVKTARTIRDELKASTKLVVSVINQVGVDVDAAKEFWTPLVDAVQIRKFLTWGYNEDKSADPTPYLDPKDRIPCPWLFERLNVDSHGDVTICGEDIAFKHKFANLKDRTLEEIWTGPEMESLRKLHLTRRGDVHPACRVCPDWKYRSWEYNYWRLIK